MIVVYTIAFTFILGMRSERFVFYLMLGLLSWTFFASSATMSTGAIVDNGGLLKSVLFPRAILPIATVLFNLAQYLLTVAVFLPLMLLWYRVPLVAPMLLFPVVPRAAGRVHHRHRADPRDGHGVLPRRPASARSRARRPVLDDADRLRAATRARAAAAAHPAQPDVAVRGGVPEDVLLPGVAGADGVAGGGDLCASARSWSAWRSSWPSKTASRSSCSDDGDRGAAAFRSGSCSGTTRRSSSRSASSACCSPRTGSRSKSSGR